MHMFIKLDLQAANVSGSDIWIIELMVIWVFPSSHSVFSKFWIMSNKNFDEKNNSHWKIHKKPL